jgi:hypothetical protein
MERWVEGRDASELAGAGGCCPPVGPAWWLKFVAVGSVQFRDNIGEVNGVEKVEIAMVVVVWRPSIVA